MLPSGRPAPRPLYTTPVRRRRPSGTLPLTVPAVVCIVGPLQGDGVGVAPNTDPLPDGKGGCHAAMELLPNGDPVDRWPGRAGAGGAGPRCETAAPGGDTPEPGTGPAQDIAPPAQQLGRPAKTELVSRCQQRPVCRAKLDMAQRGQRPVILRAAATSPSPLELELRRLPPPATPVIPRRFQRSGLGLWPAHGLLAWLNPFRPPVAEAQAGVSVYLTPQTPYVPSPASSLTLWGVTTSGYYDFRPDFSTPFPLAENKPFVSAIFEAPASGWHIIDVRAGSAAAKLRHQADGPIIETWDVGSVPCNATGTSCDYVTAEYLQQGHHAFIFYSATSDYYFYSVSIESYP